MLSDDPLDGCGRTVLGPVPASARTQFCCQNEPRHAPGRATGRDLNCAPRRGEARTLKQRESFVQPGPRSVTWSWPFDAAPCQLLGFRPQSTSILPNWLFAVDHRGLCASGLNAKVDNLVQVLSVNRDVQGPSPVRYTMTLTWVRRPCGRMLGHVEFNYLNGPIWSVISRAFDPPAPMSAAGAQ